MDEETKVQGIHAGRTVDADDMFLKKNLVAIGWETVPDLRQLKPIRAAFKEAVSVAYPEKKPASIPINAEQLFRFVYEMKVGDYVVYPSKRERNVHIGQIKGD